MTATRGVIAAFTLSATSLGPASSGLAQPSTRAYVLDTGARELVALEMPSGKRLGSLALTGSPGAMVQSPDGSRLVVLDRGLGEDKGQRGYKARGKSSATVVDPSALTVVDRTELGFGLDFGRFYLSPDSRRLTLLCPGYEAKDPAEALVRELVSVDLRTAREAGRLTLEAGAVPIVASKDGRTLPLIQGLPRTDHFPYPRSRLFIVDLEGPSLRATLDLGTWANLYTDGANFDLLDPGHPDKNPQKSKNGTMQVASLDRGVLAASLDVGRGPRGLYQDESGGQVFIPADGPLGRSAGELRVVRGAEIASTLEVAANPKLFRRRRDTAYVVGENALTLADPVALEVTARIPLALGQDALIGPADLPTEIEVSADGKRAFVLYGVHNKVVTLDLEAKRAVGSTKTGRGGKKLFGNLMGGMFGMAGFLAAGYSPWAFASPAMLAVRPDGRYAYAINTQTNDVTVVDGATGKAVEMVGGSGYALELLEGGGVLAVLSRDELRLIDTQKNTKSAEIPLPDFRGIFRPPDRATIVALAKGLVLVLDGTTGREIRRLSNFQSPDAVAFDPPR